jgi:hypothetical protein
MVTLAVTSGVLGFAACPPLLAPALLALCALVSLVTTLWWIVGHQRALRHAFCAGIAASVARASRYHLGTLMIIVAASGLLLSVVQFIDWGTEPKRQLLLRYAAAHAGHAVEARREALANERLAALATDSHDADYYRSQADELHAAAENLQLLAERYRRAAASVGTPAALLSPQTRSLLQASLPPE